jgi:hypothetical protein
MCEPWRLTILCVFTACYRDRFTFYFCHTIENVSKHGRGIAHAIRGCLLIEEIRTESQVTSWDSCGTKRHWSRNLLRVSLPFLCYHSTTAPSSFIITPLNGPWSWLHLWFLSWRLHLWPGTHRLRKLFLSFPSPISLESFMYSQTPVLFKKNAGEWKFIVLPRFKSPIIYLTCVKYSCIRQMVGWK